MTAVPVTRGSHLLWSLTEDTEVHTLTDGTTVIRTSSEDVGPLRLDETAREVLWRMTLGPASLQNVRALAAAWTSFRTTPEKGCYTAWMSVRTLLSRLPGCVVLSVALEDEWRHSLSIVPYGPSRPRFDDLPDTVRLRTPHTLRRSKGRTRGHDFSLACDATGYVAEFSSAVSDIVRAFAETGRTVAEVSPATGAEPVVVSDIAHTLAVADLIVRDD